MNALNEGEDVKWQCQNPKCGMIYAEYTNGCPRCMTGEAGGSHSVRAMATSTSAIIINISNKQLDVIITVGVVAIATLLILRAVKTFTN